ncbi:MAG: hypothetical protein M0T70_18385 [Geobacteraceae bacterium]|nr:hypothetical protein [Geobacteraceae bacterium]
MLKRIVILFLIMCVALLACGTVQVACAGWAGPPIIIQQPQFQPPQPQQIQTLPTLQPALKDIPSAPRVVTGNADINSGTAGGSDNPAVEPARTEPRPEPAPVKEPVPPPLPAEKPAPVPAPEPSNSKTPWLLAAGVVAAAFMLGRRTR